MRGRLEGEARGRLEGEVRDLLVTIFWQTLSSLPSQTLYVKEAAPMGLELLGGDSSLIRVLGSINTQSPNVCDGVEAHHVTVT